MDLTIDPRLLNQDLALTVPPVSPVHFLNAEGGVSSFVEAPHRQAAAEIERQYLGTVASQATEAEVSDDSEDSDMYGADNEVTVPPSTDLPQLDGNADLDFDLDLDSDSQSSRARSTPEPVQTESGQEWEVERVLDVRGTRRGREFLVHWLGFPDSDDTWEPAENLTNAGDLVQSFLDSKRSAEESDDAEEDEHNHCDDDLCPTCGLDWLNDV